MNRASFKVLSWIFLRHGNLTFGGGTATIAVLDREIIDQRNLLHRRPRDPHRRVASLLPRRRPGDGFVSILDT
jgi:chromate transport protein ChrA